MNEKKTITIVCLETGALREYSGYWTWKECYEEVRKIEKSKKWRVKNIEIEL